MWPPRKTVRTVAVALTFGIIAGNAHAQSLDQLDARQMELDELLAELRNPELPTWESVEQKIIRLWSESGSDTVDYLLSRGEEALRAEDYPKAVEHFTAVIDHAPDFAEGWNSRATAFFLMEEFGLALEDVHRALALNPDHFGALSGAGIIYEQMGEYHLALRALRLAHALNPHHENVGEAIERLKGRIGESTL